MKKNSSSLYLVLIALLGIAIGAMAVSTINAYFRKKALLRTEYIDWRKLNLALQTIDKAYVEEVDRSKVTDAALSAALSALDPHSVYMPPVEREASEEDLSGGFYGIGIQFNVPNDTAVVLEVIPGGPSEKIGIRPADRILKVDDRVIAGVKCPQDTMVRLMRGKSGTKVTITIGRGEETIPFEITRGKIPTYSVDAAFMVNDTTGYLRLSKFTRTTAKECREACEKLVSQGMKTLIFDIRDNTGGYLDQALSLSELFLEKDKLIVYLEGLHHPREDCVSHKDGEYRDLGLKILINEGSASASEIFAGAMQDNGRAQIIGRRSFGKGLVQEPFNFSDGSGLRLTVARFHTPCGRCIQKPYTDDYDYEVYKRYNEGEMTVSDSMKVEKGGILPDIFVPVDTTKASDFFIKCNRKATTMRFASYWFDRHYAELASIDDYGKLLKYLDSCGLEKAFLDYAASHDGIKPVKGEWADTRKYMLPQIQALVGRYSKVGDNAFYHLYLQIDDTFAAALE